MRLSGDLAQDVAALLRAHGCRVEEVKVERLPARRTVYRTFWCAGTIDGEDVPTDFPVVITARGVRP